MDTLAYYKQLISIRKSRVALRRGRYQRLHTGALSYAFSRATGDDKLIVALNAGDKALKLEIPVKGLVEDGATLKALYGKDNVTVEGGMVKISVPARDGIILSAQ